MIATLFYNPSVAYGDSPAGPAPPLSALRTFPPLPGESALYTRGPFWAVINRPLFVANLTAV